MAETELQKLKREYAESDMTDAEFEERLRNVDLEAEVPSLWERTAAIRSVLIVLGIVAIFIALFFVTKGQIMFVAPPAILIIALLYGYYRYVKWRNQ